MPPRTQAVEQAAQERRKAAERQPVDPPSGLVAALLEERRGYVVRGLDGRVAQVDEQLRLHQQKERTA